MKKLDYIDSLRGIAILGVIIVHTSQGISNLEPKILHRIFLEGSKGVQLFYIASAFTLFLSFKNRLIKEHFPIRNFFIRRFFRIAPMYYLGLCYYLVQNGTGARFWLGDETHISILNIISNLFFFHGFNPYWINSLVPGGWSIGVEMTFYLLLPFLFSKLKNINSAFNFFLFSLTIKFLLQTILIRLHPIGSDVLWSEFVLNLYFPSQLPIFSLGILMYFIISERESITDISGKSLLIFSIIIIVQLASGIHSILSSSILFSIGFLILGIALNNFRFKLIVNPIINHIGKVSFSLYLVHFGVMYWLTIFKIGNYFETGVLNFILRFTLVTSLGSFIATLLYNFIEIPFQNLGKKIIKKMENNYSMD